MINKLFPYKLHLQIFQLGEYDSGRFLVWVLRHFFTRTIENKKPLVWTQKAKVVYFLSLFLAVVILILLTILFRTYGFIFGLLLSTQSYIFILFASYFLLPLELYTKDKIKKQTAYKLASLKHLKIIGITGSYGKTSVKEFLYQIVKTQYAVLKTPGSYNTPYGIAKVVDLELDDSYEYFVCEMGAYKAGDIKEICDIVHPRYGILTGINAQHIETFGSIENTTKGKFELIESLPANGFGIVNIDNEHIRNALAGIREKQTIIHDSLFLIQNKHLTTYGFSDEKFSIRKIKQTPHGSEFLLILDGKVYDARTKLLGIPNLQNILAAATMSYLLGMRPQTIITAIAHLKPVPHRLEIKELENMTVIDDAYNSNVDGFKEAITLLSFFKNRPTVFVTPGIVDLGEKTVSIHRELGALLDEFDYVFLIGDSVRTKGLQEGMKNKDRIITLKSVTDVWLRITKLYLENPVILLENDLPDNY